MHRSRRRAALAVAARLVVASVAALATVARAEPPTRAPAVRRLEVRGVVRDRAGAPMAGVAITAAPGGELAVTDAAGRFALALPPGRHRLALAAAWIAPLALDVVVGGAARDLAIEVAPAGGAGERIEVRGDGGVARGVRLSGAEARAAAGSGGEALRAVQSLPGVARAAGGSDDLVVWGAAPRDTQVFVDGVPVPWLYHPGGLRALIPSGLVEAVELVPGAYPVDRPGGIGGLVEVQSRELPDALGGELELGSHDATAIGFGAPRPGLRVGGGLRMSTLDGAVRAIAERAGVAPFPVPSYGDALVKASLARRKDERVSVFALASGDREERVAPSDDPASVRAAASERLIVRLGARYHRVLVGGHYVEAVGWIGHDRERATSRTGAVATERADRARVLGARGAYVHLLPGGAALTIGADVLSASHALIHDGSLTVPPREGDVAVFVQPPGDEVAVDRWRAAALEAAAYARVDLELGRFALTPGLRVPAYLMTASDRIPRPPGLPPIGAQEQEVVLEPRLGAALDLGAVTARVDGGRYHQPPDPADTSAVLGNPTLGLERAWQGAITLAARPTRELSLEAAGWGRRSDALAARPPDPSPPLAGALAPSGEARAAGVQLAARLREVGGLAGFVAYGLSRSDRRATADAAWRRFDHDQTHAVVALASYRVGATRLGARARWVTGEPRTPVVDAYFDAGAGRYLPIVGRHNAERLPPFASLDLRAERRFAAAGGDLGAFVEVDNATGRRNAEEFVYAGDFAERGVLAGPPLLVFAGVTGAWP